MNKVITIPKKMLEKGELVLIPRSEYEEFLFLKKIIPLVEPSLSEKRVIKIARRQIKQGKHLTLKQVKNELED